MQVYQLIYTKVPPAESPWGKSGFHTVFYPIHFLNRTEVLELEKRIHFPGSEDFDSKDTVFFQNLRGRHFLMIWNIRNLPGARDIFGRGGMFLSQGFLFPPEIWQKGGTPQELLQLVTAYRFNSLEEVLTSPRIDKKSGDLQPLEVTIGEEEYEKTLPPLSTDLERKLLIFLARMARSSKEQSELVLRGSPEKISELLNRIFSFLPNDLKVNLAWDPSLDGGNLAFYPIKIVGFKNRPPVGGHPLMVDLEAGEFQETPKTARAFSPETPLEKWLWHCPAESVRRSAIEGAHRLSCLLQESAAFSQREELLLGDCFVAVNQDEIRGAFFRRTESFLGRELTLDLAKYLTTRDMLALLVNDLPLPQLALFIEEIVLAKRLTPWNFKGTLSEALVKAGSLRLNLITKIWKGGRFEPGELRPLDSQKRLELIRYLLLGGWGDKDWFTDLLKENLDIFDSLVLRSDTQPFLARVLSEMLKRRGEFKDIADILAREGIRQKKGAAILLDEVNPWEILEQSISQGSLLDAEMNQIISWAKKARPPQGTFMYVQMFLYPKMMGMVQDYLDARIREKLLKTLILSHGYDQKDLQELGFTPIEIEKFAYLETNRRWLTKIRSLFSAKNK